MKRFYILLLLFFSSTLAYSNHITGGEMYYTLTGQSGNNYTYHVVLKLYRDCFSTGAQLDNTASISIFNNSNNISVWNDAMVTRDSIVTLQITSPDPCINNPPPVCYQVGYYSFDVTLPGTPQGYTIAYQRCCRINGISNVTGSNNVGATYTAVIPGSLSIANGPENNSAHFTGKDTVVICANNAFCYDFGASDLDGDALSYSFCTAITGGNSGNPAPSPPASPPYAAVPYSGSYGGNNPLGFSVTLNPNTGMMCGVAPAAGIYVVTVCVTETRNGIAIAIQRKDLQIKVGDCSLTTPLLDQAYITCDGYNVDFFNRNDNPLVTGYLWDFGDGTTSNLPTPTHTYADTGVYSIKLVVNPGAPCSDFATSEAKVYPGFFPGFIFTGVCMNKPTQFFDTTRTAYGIVDSWNWDFGDLTTFTDTSTLKNPAFTYQQTGTNNVKLIVTSNKGCIDTVFKDINIIDKPPLTALPNDTLICNGDNVQLQAVGNGLFSWSGSNIINANTATPTVSPTVTSNYIVQLDDNGCLNQDTVRVRVVDFVTLQARSDTIICLGDPVQLTALTDGLRFSWTPAATLNNPNILSPTAIPTATTTYQITSIIGSCSATDDLTVSIAPFPVANAGPDTVICFNTSAQLHASMVGNSFSWTPSSSLNNPNILNPIASPVNTTRYILTVRDIIGCPKPKFDTVLVTVLPKLNAFAGGDTSVVIGQPLQFNAVGGISFIWSPSLGLSQTNIANPIGIYDGGQDSIQYKVVMWDENGCTDSAFIRVRIFKTSPWIFVPTAFTPNGDGKNDVFRPLGVGISKIDYFRVYNRWGQLVFSTTVNEHGWDGKIGGREQGSGTFVWLVKGVDFTGKVVFSKGTVTLIR